MAITSPSGLMILIKKVSIPFEAMTLFVVLKQILIPSIFWQILYQLLFLSF
jgi:hypothetical protein